MPSTEQQQKPAPRCRANPLQLPKPLLRLTLLLLIALGAPSLHAAQPVAPENHRITLRTLDPNAAPVSQWRVKVRVGYNPLVEGSPNTTETTTSRSNCGVKPRFDILPRFERCTSTRNRVVSSVLPAEQMRAVDAHTLNLDFAPVVEDGGGTFGIYEISMEYIECAKGCELRTVDFSLACWADGVERGEILAQGIVMSYSQGSRANPGVAECGLQKASNVPWASREEVMKRVRGHFGEEERTFSRDLLNAYAAVPTRENGWQWNPAQKARLHNDTCQLAPGETYLTSDSRVSLPVSAVWPYRNEVEVRVTRKPNGEVCSVWLSGSDDELYLRYFYTFENGQLITVSIDGEPDDVSREWRWVNGEPWEYTRRQMPDAIVGHDAILYWHKGAAEQWPERMDYSPDFEEFAGLKGFAGELVDRFGK